MWEPNDGSGGRSRGSTIATTATSSRGLILLVTVLSLCVFLYKVWGPLLLVTCALVLVVHTCYSLLVNDSLFAPHTFVLLGYVKELTLELALTIRALLVLAFDKSKLLLEYLKRQYEERCKRQLETSEDNMSERRRIPLYKPSVSVPNKLGENISPRNSDLFQSFTMNGSCNIGKTSTPIPRGSTFRKDEKQNGGLYMHTPVGLIKKHLPLRTDNKHSMPNLPRNEELSYNSKNSSWNNSVSPKMKDKSDSIKTVQTVAGPLLTSSRFNIDPKLYTDISSPGLTSRLTKYAAEANNKLTHQSQYGAGQFPKVNLNASPIPLMSPKVMRARTPVTVRVAPPEITNYAPPDSSIQQEISKYSSSEVRESKSCPSVVQVLKKMALKRHASREDIMLELAKKQKAEKTYEDQIENLEEMMQKRARDESTTSEDDLSPQSKNQRPAKRPKAASSCHDVLNSLSSSINVYPGVKRKAMDSSQPNSPETEKHFKSSTSPNRSSSLPQLTSRELAKSKEQLNVKVACANASGEPYQSKVQNTTPEISKIDAPSLDRQQQSRSSSSSSLSTSTVQKEVSALSKTQKLTDKLFMKPDPQNNEKLKSLIQEQGNMEVKFKTDDKDEIKKQDIDNMRQNSMRMRLKSMFDAISGKSASKIDPDVVIQAEEVNPPVTSTFVSLNSQTSTTTVNTSPITTTIVPILKTDTEKSPPTAKHVTFNLPTSSSTLTTSSSSALSTITNSEASKPSEPKSLGTSSLGGFSATTTSTPTFNFGSNSITTTSATVTSTAKPVIQASTSGFSFSASSSTTSVSTTSSSSTTISKSPTSSSITPSLFAPKSTTESATSSSSNVIASSGFSFNAAPKITPSISAPTTTSSAPAFSFSSAASFANTKSTAPTVTTSSPVINFNNQLSKSPTNVSIAQSTNSLPTFTSEKKDGGFSFNAPSTTSLNTNNQSSSMFNAPTSNSMFSTSNATTNATSAATTTTATTSTPSIFNFGANKPATAGFSFSGTTAPTISFGTNAQNNASSSAIKTSTFSMPTVSTTTTTASTPAFNSTPSLFNAPTNSSSLFSGSPALGSSSMFKSPSTAPTTTVASIFGGPSPGFGTTPATTATTATPSLFGNNAVANSTSATTIPSLFANTGSTTVSTAPTMTPFGAPASQQQQQSLQPQSNIFAGGNATAAPSIFGSTGPSTGLFSGTSPAATNPVSSTNSAENTSIFGQTKAPAPLSFGGTNSTFGTNNTASGFSAPNMNNPTSNTSSFQLGAPSNSGSLPSFGSIKPSPQFGSQTPASSGGSIFGSSPANNAFGSTNTGSAPSAFGSPNPTSQPPAFGSTAPGGTFGSTAPSGTFGMPNNNVPGSAPPAFGSSTSTFGNPSSSTSPFGAPVSTTSTPTLFGNTTPASAGGATFSFGGAQTQTQQPQQQQQPQQPSTGFSFGGATNANAANSGGLFQFGGNNAAKPAGFNFSAPNATPSINFSGSAAPPVFNAPAPNMFSIGSGPSTPRSRTSRQRRQR